ncbi:dynamin ARC5 isoform X1 [Olea europaea subsp. europaea]|uniref:Dynamin ARC5 isoform X1 n=1 Tax=Olea europaea subsp. europaea TaxID=158383 RepID=A0A8S0QFN0_OLEEU|nr:dynamin ARC5 isoform X1 [Olea europaea subsp. europaea]
MVQAKMQHKEFIILCLEDCNDWSNATMQRIVMQIDPELSRTVIVSTKLDTKIPQFARASDVDVFLSPPACTLDGFMLGDSPFFTSVPSGRVGSGHESVYRSIDEFKQMEDITALEEKLGRSLSKQERNRIGVSSLRLLQKRYMDSVPMIIPLLEKEYRSTTRKLIEINQELSTLDVVKLKEKGRAFHDLFLTKLSHLLKGTVIAPLDKFGETLQNERVNGGAFIGSDGLQFPHKLIPGRWDESFTSPCPERVSPWEIELALTTAVLNPLPVSKTKRSQSNILPSSLDSSVRTREASSKITVDSSAASGFPRVLQELEFSTLRGTFVESYESDSSKKPMTWRPSSDDQNVIVSMTRNHGSDKRFPLGRQELSFTDLLSGFMALINFSYDFYVPSGDKAGPITKH